MVIDIHRIIYPIRKEEKNTILPIPANRNTYLPTVTRGIDMDDNEEYQLAFGNHVNISNECRERVIGLKNAEF